MSTISSQIQKAINEAISDQILLQLQATLKSGQGRIPEREWARNTDMKKPWTVCSGATPEMSATGFQAETKT